MGHACSTLTLSCFCCHALPSSSWITRSACTKIAYLLLFFTCQILMTVAVHAPWVTRNLPFCQNDESLLCSKFSGFPATYRICLAYVLFFTFMWLCTIGISSSRNSRSVIHNGFWFFKIACIVLLLVGTAYIPHGLFDKVFMYFGLVFIFVFNVFEMFLYIQLLKNFSYYCRVLCLRQASGCTKFIATFFALLLEGAGAAIFVVLLILYNDCLINLVFNLLNMVVSTLLSLGSLCLKFQKRDWNSLLEGSVLSTHVMFLTWSAITNNPRDKCSPSREIAKSFFVTCNLLSLIFGVLATILAVEYFFQKEQDESSNPVVYVEERGTEICGIWGRRKLVQTIQPENSTIPPEGIIYRSTDSGDDEYNRVKYFWNAMHNVYIQAIFYIMLCFTDNYMYSKTPTKPLYYNEAAMWFKISSSWMCMLSFVLIEFLPDSTTLNLRERS